MMTSLYHSLKSLARGVIFSAAAMSVGLGLRLESVERRQRALVDEVAGVERARRLEQQHFHFLIRHGPVVHAPRHDDELAGLEDHGAIAKLEAQPPANNEKELVFGVMMMPVERSQQLRQLHHLAVQFPYNLGGPVLPEAGELLREVDLIHGRLRPSPAPPAAPAPHCRRRGGGSPPLPPAARWGR